MADLFTDKGGFFTKLFARIFAPKMAAISDSDAARLRETVADERARIVAKKQQQAQPSPKDKADGQTAQILASLGTAAGQAVADAVKRRVAERRSLRQPTPEERFLAGDYRLTHTIDFQSSNPSKPAVYQVWYVPAEKSIYVTFYTHTRESYAPGPTYRYWTIGAAEAARMFRASSKGIEVWDTFRVRGSKTAHKKSYALVGAGGATQVPAQQTAPAPASEQPGGGLYAALGKFAKSA